MSEGFHEQMPRRGRRRADLAQMDAPDVETPAEHFTDAGESVAEDALLFEGDVVFGKITQQFDDGSNSPTWCTYGVQTRLQPGESEADAFYRVSTVVNNRVLQQYLDGMALIEENREQIEAQLYGQRRG